MTNVGKISVRVFPDTSKFRDDIKKALDRIEKSVKGTVQVEAELDRSSLANVSRQIKALAESVSLDVKANTSVAKAEIASLGDSTSAEVDVDVRSAAAKAQLAEIAHDRIVTITAIVKNSGAGNAATSLMGGNVLKNMMAEISQVSTNLDTMAVGFAKAGTKVAGMSAIALSGAGNVLSLAGSLATVAPAALALPGIFAGVKIATGVLKMAMMDAATVLADLAPQFAELQKNVSTAFWSKAEAPIRGIVDALMPLANQWLPEIANQFTDWANALNIAITSATNLDTISSVLSNVADMVNISGEGIGSLTNGLIGLVGVGANYLPALASAFNDVMESFSNWVDNSIESGSINTMIDTAIVGLKQLGSIIGSVAGILGGLVRAATNAGGGSLGALAEGLQKINTAVNGPAFQGALTTIFQGAFTAVSNLSPGIKALGDAFLSLAPVLAQVMTLAGTAISNLMTGLSQALSNTTFQEGLVTAFEAIVRATETLQPAFDLVGQKAGDFMKVFATILDVLAPVVTTIITGLVPALSTFMTALQPVIQAVGTGLTNALAVVLPAISGLVTWISGLMTQFPGLTAAIIAVVAGIAMLAPPIISAVAGLISFGTAIAPVVTWLISFSTFLDLIGLSLTSLLAPFLAVGAAITALGAFLVYAWTVSEQFRAAVTNLMTTSMTALAPIIALGQTVFAVAQQIFQAFMSMVMTVANALIPLVTTVTQIVAQIIAIFTPLIAFITSVLTPVFTFLGAAVSAAFTYIGSVISSAIAFINSILQVFLAVLQGNWTGAWNALGGVVQSAWALIRSIVSGGIQFIQSIVSAGLSAISSIFSTVWSAISSIVSSVISGIVSFISSGFSTILSVVSSILSSILSTVSSIFSSIISTVAGAVSSMISAISSGFQSAVSAVASAMSSFASAVSSGIQNVLGFFRNLGSQIAGIMGGIVGQMGSIGANIVQGLANGIRNAAGAVMNAAKAITDKLPAVVKKALGIHSPSRVFMSLGDYTMQGFAKGINGGADAAYKAMSNAVTPPPAPSIQAPDVEPTALVSGAQGGVAGGAMSPDTLLPLMTQAFTAAMATMKPVVQIGNYELYGAMQAAQRKVQRI